MFESLQHKGKVSIGRVRYLLNTVFYTPGCSNHLFSEMLIYSLIMLLISNAISLRIDKSILYSRIAILSLGIMTILSFNNLYVKGFEKSIGIFGGLFNVSLLTYTFNIFIFIITIYLFIC